MNRGAQAELLAARFLGQHGLTLLHQNFRCRYGEIDLIMRDGTTLVFVEVRLRTRSDFGGAAASINFAKRERLLRTARHYLSLLKQVPPCRFDALLLHSTDGNDIEWIKNAFSG